MSAASDLQAPRGDRDVRSPRGDRELLREEAAIARRYMGRVPWEMVAWGLGNVVFWLALWPLVLGGVLPLWAGFLLSTISIAISYLPSHEAQHSIIATRGSPLRWLNELVGHVSTLPLVLPYRMAWITHRQHHAHANDPELDPDYGSKADTWYETVWKTLRHGESDAYVRCVQASDDPDAGRALVEAAAMRIGYYAILAGLAWSGHALEALFLWWLPRRIATSYILLFLSWAPHYPMEEKGRYRDTRAWRSPVGTILSLGMEYHVVHHLFPRIPLLQTGPAFHELRPLLEERGIRNDGL